VRAELAFPGRVRASDSDRERAVALLHRNYAAGRLTLAEFESRIARAYGAGWRSDLREVLHDLPFEVDRSRIARRIDSFQRVLFRIHAWGYTAFNTMLVSIWAWSGGHEFWPAFSIVPGGLVLLWHRAKSRAATRRLQGGPPPRAISRRA
jgi:hypothetical protein